MLGEKLIFGFILLPNACIIAYKWSKRMQWIEWYNYMHVCVFTQCTPFIQLAFFPYNYSFILAIAMFIIKATQLFKSPLWNGLAVCVLACCFTSWHWAWLLDCVTCYRGMAPIVIIWLSRGFQQWKHQGNEPLRVRSTFALSYLYHCYLAVFN